MQDHRPVGSLRRLDADDPLVAVLGRLEPVNPPSGPRDLARRLAEDRLVYVLEVDGEPAATLWVALTAGVPARLAEVLDPTAPTLEPDAASTAVFHSVWNLPDRPTVPGAARSTVELALEDLHRRRPGVTTAATISPVPGLRAWLAEQGVDRAPAGDELADLARTYLRSTRDGVPVDPVARFHLGNGARLWRILPDADPSPLGLERSFGLMANYRYEPEDRAANRAALADGVVTDGVVTDGVVADDSAASGRPDRPPQT